MRLAFVNGSYPAMPCGIGDYAAKLAAAAVAAGHDVVVFTSADPRVRVSSRPPVRPLFKDWTVGEFLRHVGEIRAVRPDAVVLQYPSLLPGPHSRLLFLLPLLVRAFLPSARVVLIVHEFAHTHRQAKRLLRLSFRFAHEIVALNPSDLQAMQAASASARARARQAGIGSNIPRVPLTVERRHELRVAAGARDGRLIFFFGLLHGPGKGLEDLLEALPELDRSALLAVGGSLPDGPHRRELFERVAVLGLKGRLRWLGYLDPEKLSEWLQAADVVALPFRGGAAPNRGTLAAALLNGCALVTTYGTDTPDWLADGEAAVLVPARDPHALAAALGRLVDSSAERSRLRRGAERIAHRFDWDAVLVDTLGSAASPPAGD